MKKVADMGVDKMADMEVDEEDDMVVNEVADMEVKMVTNMVADEVVDMEVNKKQPSWGPGVRGRGIRSLEVRCQESRVGGYGGSGRSGGRGVRWVRRAGGLEVGAQRTSRLLVCYIF